MKFEITKEDIDLAINKRKSSGYSPAYDCPIALALTRLFKNGWMGIFSFGYDDGTKLINLKATEEMRQFMLKFDDRKKVGPITFEI